MIRHDILDGLELAAFFVLFVVSQMETIVSFCASKVPVISVPVALLTSHFVWLESSSRSFATTLALELETYKLPMAATIPKMQFFGTRQRIPTKEFVRFETNLIGIFGSGNLFRCILDNIFCHIDQRAAHVGRRTQNLGHFVLLALFGKLVR
jgi:hypothetical protein